MGIFDKAKELAAGAATGARDAAIERVGEMRDEAAARSALARTFRATRDFDRFSIDSRHSLIKFKQATAEIKPKGMGVAGKATLAVLTGGISLVGEAFKPRDVIVPFDAVVGYEPLVDGQRIDFGHSETTAGGAVIGFVGVGKASTTRVSTSRKLIDTMAIRVDLDDLDVPCVMLTFVARKTSTDSDAYRKALGRMQEASRALDLILSGR